MNILILALSYIFLIFSAFAGGGDNLKLTKYARVIDLPKSYVQLTNGDEFFNRTYLDNSNRVRSDKVFYTMSHSYRSSLSLSELKMILNPANNRLGNLFEETLVSKTKLSGIFSVQMNISTPLKDFGCESLLHFSASNLQNKYDFNFEFKTFNMVFTGMFIKVEVEDLGHFRKISLSQISALRGMTHQKLKNFYALEKFEDSLKDNILRFKDGIGGY
jgi:hypothetical protein